MGKRPPFLNRTIFKLVLDTTDSLIGAKGNDVKTESKPINSNQAGF